MEKRTTSKRIHVFLCPPKMRIQQVSIVPTRKIECLQKLFGIEKKFIFNGMLLDQEQTFNFYRIVEGSHIILLPKDKEESSKDVVDCQSWLNITKESDIFLEKIQSSRNGVTKKEAARLRDMKFSRIEGKSREYLKYYNEFEDLSLRNSQNNDDLNIDFQPLETPSMEPLPSLWMNQPYQPPPQYRNPPNVNNANNLSQ